LEETGIEREKDVKNQNSYDKKPAWSLYQAARLMKNKENKICIAKRVAEKYNKKVSLPKEIKHLKQSS
jgi:hypothetical protein